MRTYIKWIRFEEKGEKPESGKNYLVSQGFKRGALRKSNMFIATYHDKGDVVDAEVPDDGTMPDNTEERLLKAIFGATKKVQITEDGFYVISHDVTLRESVYDGCISFPVLEAGYSDDSEDVYYAELPVAPNGYIHPYDYDGYFKEIMEKQKKDGEADNLREYAEIADVDAEISEYHEHLGNYQDFKDPDNNLYYSCGLCYDINEQKAKRTLVNIHTVILVCGFIMDNYTPEQLKAVLAEDTAHTALENMYEKAGIPKGDIRYRDKNTRLFVINKLDAYTGGVKPAYCWYKSFIDYMYPKSSEVDKTIKAETMFQLDNRIDRIIKLRSFGAPDIILKNEYRIAFENGYGYFNKYECMARDFSNFYGITAEGEKAEYKPGRPWFVKMTDTEDAEG